MCVGKVGNRRACLCVFIAGATSFLETKRLIDVPEGLRHIAWLSVVDSVPHQCLCSFSGICSSVSQLLPLPQLTLISPLWAPLGTFTGKNCNLFSHWISTRALKIIRISSERHLDITKHSKNDSFCTNWSPPLFLLRLDSTY